MRDILKAILASPVPVAAFVGPSGARAASAGTYILYASHVAAMAPGTKLGAATPVQVGIPGIGTPEPPRKPADDSTKGKADKGKSSDEGGASPDPMTRKQVHDAAAYIRGLAQMRGRNVEWGERAVREAVSLSADEALAQKVIDVIARDVPELVAELDGRGDDCGRQHVLQTAVVTTTIEPDWKSRFLAVITDPGMALILMMIGVYGLFFEVRIRDSCSPASPARSVLWLRSSRCTASQLRRARADPSRARLLHRRSVRPELRRAERRWDVRDRCSAPHRFDVPGSESAWADRGSRSGDRGIRRWCRAWH
jgi:membrane-bound ClpP family serine protease